MTNSLDMSLEDVMGAIDVNDVDGAGVVTPGFSHEATEMVSRPSYETTESDNESLVANTASYGNSSPVIVLRDYCLRAWGSSCSRCKLFCPEQAISLAQDRVPVIDVSRCSGCGVCVGVCDAFTIPGFGLAELHGRIRTKALIANEVFITCQSCLAENEQAPEYVEVLPSLALLSPELLCHLLIESTKITVAGDLRELFNESHGGRIAEMLFDQTVALAETWSGQKVGYREALPQVSCEDLAQNNQLKSRREYFDDVVSFLAFDKDAFQSKRAGNHQMVLERRQRIFTRQALVGLEIPRINAFMSGHRLKQVMWPKRRLLLESILACQDVEARVMLRVSDTDRQRCDDCLACVEVCPSKARFAHPDDGLLEFDIRYCIGCGLCEEVCPTEAIALEVSIPSED